MEAYVFALMANSGTDPDLEEEDAKNDAGQRPPESRYLTKLGEDGEPIEDSTSGGETVEDADLVDEPAVLDHYSVCWPPGETIPPSPKVFSRNSDSPKSEQFSTGVPTCPCPSQFDSKGEASPSFTSPRHLPELPSPAPTYLIKISDHAQKHFRTSHRPARFQMHSTANTYSSLPPLRLSMPRFQRNKCPMAPGQKFKESRASFLRKEQRAAIHANCNKVPRHPMNGLYWQSYQVLNKHYNSLGPLCYLEMQKLEQ